MIMEFNKKNNPIDHWL